MLDLGIKKFEKFSLPEEIVGQKVILRPRTHEYDDKLFELIDSSREFLREYLFWVDDTQSVDDVRQITDIFQENWKKQEAFEYVFLDRKRRCWSVPEVFIQFHICIILRNTDII